MYTQCPECSVAFRVTADVLKQAAGKVRCGGCGSAFNALEYLSEEKPASPPRTHAEPDLPELTPDLTDDPESHAAPQSISAEHSAALLKTLDQLAGEDIRIEDTGVEWRVLDVDEEIGLGDDNEKGPGEAESGIRHENEEMRFDDDTPLPDDFDYQSEPIAPPEPAAESESPASEVDFAQVDLAFGSTLDWEELLDEVGDAGIAGNVDDDLVAAADESETDRQLEADDADAPEADEPESDFAGRTDVFAETVGPRADETAIAAPKTVADDALPEEFPVDIDENQADQDALADDLPGDDSPTQIEAELEEREQALRDRLLDAGETDAGEDRPAIDEAPVVPELSEEEKTINMMIDQDLLAAAVEDEDGLVSTIVPVQPAWGRDAPDEEPPSGTEETDDSERPLVETIIMEGESVRGTLDDRGDENKAAAEVSLAALEQPVEVEPKARADRRMVAALIGLVLLLCLQFVHHSREALATVPAINSAIGPIYRAIGRPVAPAWDINGWRFEATKGSTDENEQLLTIYSRIGNTSNDAMPLPLIHVALTDRFEEPIGSRIMEPDEYIVGGADPRQTVASGETFNAVISIGSPSPDATGFQLNVCYRLPNTQLKCAIEDFR